MQEQQLCFVSGFYLPFCRFLHRYLLKIQRKLGSKDNLDFLAFFIVHTPFNYTTFFIVMVIFFHAPCHSNSPWFLSFEIPKGLYLQMHFSNNHENPLQFYSINTIHQNHNTQLKNPTIPNPSHYKLLTTLLLWGQ